MTQECRETRIILLFMPPPNDFQRLFCEHYAISPEGYSRALLKMAAYPHARWVLWFLGQLSDNYLQADYDFIHDVGRLTRYREYEAAVRAYVEHPMNRNNFLRSHLCLRVSANEMRRVVREVMKAKRTRNETTVSTDRGEAVGMRGRN